MSRVIAVVDGKEETRDHHRYTAAEVDELIAEVSTRMADLKDALRKMSQAMQTLSPQGSP